MYEIISLPIITAIVYGLLTIYKILIKNAPDIWTRLIPVFACVLGIITAIVLFYGIPEMMLVNNIWIALLIGGVSGLASTGTHQIIKQLTKGDEDGGEDN